MHIPPDQVKDPQEKNIPGKGLGRDLGRTPMQWNSSKYAGFSEKEPWLPLMENYEEIIVNKEIGRKDSMLTFYKRIINFRQNEPVFQIGRYKPILSGDNILAYKRVYRESEFLVVLNLSTSEETLKLKDKSVGGKILISTSLSREREKGS